MAYLSIFTVALEGKSAPKEKDGCGDRRSGVFCAVLYHSIVVAADPGLPCTPSCSCSRISAQTQKPIDEPITAQSTDLLTGGRNPYLHSHYSKFFDHREYAYALQK